MCLLIVVSHLWIAWSHSLSKVGVLCLFYWFINVIYILRITKVFEILSLFSQFRNICKCIYDFFSVWKFKGFGFLLSERLSPPGNCKNILLDFLLILTLKKKCDPSGIYFGAEFKMEIELFFSLVNKLLS